MTCIEHEERLKRLEEIITRDCEVRAKIIERLANLEQRFDTILDALTKLLGDLIDETQALQQELNGEAPIDDGNGTELTRAPEELGK